MSVKVTVPNTSSDSVVFGSANTPTAAEVVGIDSGSSNGQLAFKTTASGTSTERMRIDANGNVGINATDMSSSGKNAKLAVVGNINLDDDNFIAWGGGTGRPTFAGNKASNYMYWSISGTERMRIDSSGYVLVGVTANQTSGKMQVFNSGVIFDGAVTGTGVQAVAAMRLSKPDTTNTTSQVFVQFYVNNFGTGSGQINANGASAVAFGSFSDARLKENIEPLSPQLDNILALKPCEFDYKDGSGHQIGFIAQEMQEVYPDVVGEGADEMLTITGWSKTEARLVKAIQEQQAIITDLKSRIEALESK